MDILKFIFLLNLTSCSTIHYLWEQGLGQWHLQKEGIKVETVISNPNTNESVKEKLKIISEAKNFFYKFFEEKPSSIYSKVTFLKDEAVTYLVIASHPKEIKAFEHQFPFVGSFPYLGFFNKDSALEYSQKMIKKDFVTWMRPVYAYSTLGYFEDRILSSFFYFDKMDLVELIFHELFHTIFFIKNEVDLNENMANFFARELMKEYFKNDPSLKSYLEKSRLEDSLRETMILLVGELEFKLSALPKEATNHAANLLTVDFVQAHFIPKMTSLCLSFNNPHLKCRFDKEEWNQAHFAALKTYEENQHDIELWFNQKNHHLRSFLNSLKLAMKKYKKSSSDDVVSFLKGWFNA